jgi:integrase
MGERADAGGEHTPMTTGRRRFGSIRKLPSGRYQVRYRDQGGRQHTAAQTFATKTDAARWLAAVETDLHRGDWLDPQLGREPFSFWADEWRATTSHLRPKTTARYNSDLKMHLLPRFGPVPVAGITQGDVKRFIAEMTARGAAPASVATARKVLRVVLETARTAGAIKVNPCDGAKVGSSGRREMHFLTAEQVNDLADEIGDRHRTLVYFAAYTGMRAGEIEGLRVGRLNLLKGTADVVEAVGEVEGVGLVFGPTKTYQRRTVRLPRFLCDILGAHLAGRDAGPDAFVFPARDGRPHPPPQFLPPAFQACCAPRGGQKHSGRARPVSRRSALP